MTDSDNKGEKAEQQGSSSQLKKLGILAAMGFEFVGFVVGGALVGMWVDDHFSSSPWGVISLILLGMLAALWHVYRVITLYLK